MKKNSEIIGKINTGFIKSRDLVHLQEITHSSGTGWHRSKKDWDRKIYRKSEREY